MGEMNVIVFKKEKIVNQGGPTMTDEKFEEVVDHLLREVTYVKTEMEEEKLYQIISNLIFSIYGRVSVQQRYLAKREPSNDRLIDFLKSVLRNESNADYWYKRDKEYREKRDKELENGKGLTMEDKIQMHNLLG